MDIRLQPQGPFSNDYGATYGTLKSARKMNPPSTNNNPPPLPPDANRVVRQMTREFSEGFARSGLILMTTSGIDNNSKSPFFGPHVGSYYNMLLKRCLLSVPCPKVLFLDASKWGFTFLLNNCHSICGSDFTWESVGRVPRSRLQLRRTTRLTGTSFLNPSGSMGFQIRNVVRLSWA